MKKMFFLIIIAILTIFVGCSSDSKTNNEYTFAVWDSDNLDVSVEQRSRFDILQKEAFNLESSFSEQIVLDNLVSFIDNITFIDDNGKKYEYTISAKKYVKKMAEELDSQRLKYFMQSLSYLNFIFGHNYRLISKLDASEIERALDYIYKMRNQKTSLITKEEELWWYDTVSSY